MDDNFIIKTLDKDLLDYEKYINYLNLIKKPQIDLIIQNIKSSVNEVLPGYDIKLYGAYGSGLNLPWSDLNIILYNKNKTDTNILSYEDNITETNERETSTQSQNNDEIIPLNKNNKNSSSCSVSEINNNYNNENISLILINLYNCLKNNLVNTNQLNKSNIIKTETNSYLVINTKEEFQKIKIYISIEKPNDPGLKRLELIKSFMKEYPPLKPIVLSKEAILKKAYLNCQYQGGLPFYGLILMVVSFIQNQKEKYNYSFKEEDINGNIFYEFLKYYGIRFDFNKYVIITYKINEINSSMNEKENHISLSSNSNNQELIIIDPMDKKTNIAKQTFQYSNIKMAFLIAFMATQEECDCGCHYKRAAHQYNYISIEHCYLKRMFNSVIRYMDDGN